ncbi:MAG: hypothetical protein ACHQ15_06320 [Candidatus Limnocylindrales bacterium]
MPRSPYTQFRSLLALSVGGVLLAAACSADVGAGATPTAGSGTPAPTSTTSGGGYGGGGGNDYPVPTPTSGSPATPIPTTGGSSGGTTVTISAAQSASLGTYLTGKGGLTLYTNSYIDSASSSGCSGSCAQTWPPYTVGANVSANGGAGVTGNFGTFTRTDGSVQLTYDDQPLYYYSGDTKSGDTKGNGLDNGYWQVAAP